MDSRGLIFPALDTTWSDALRIAEALRDHPAIGGLKINRLAGQALFMPNRNYINRLHDFGLDIWIDAKHIDIPETVEGWIEAYAVSGMISFVTVMAKGGLAMMKKAVAAAGSEMDIIGVTELTSLSLEEVQDLSGRFPLESVLHLATLAEEAGLHHLVCSGREVEALYEHNGLADMSVIVPATEPKFAKAGSGQKRTTPLEEVCRVGKDMIGGFVFGRIIGESKDPRATVNMIAEEIEAV